MLKNKIMLVVMSAALMAFASACGNAGGASQSGSSASSEGGDKLSGKITIAGSTALEPLVAAASSQFMKEHPNVQIQVSGGGSGTGLSEVSRGNVDIGMSDYFAESKKGIPADKLADHQVAVVGMTAAVNPEAGVKNLSQQQLIKVFTGKVTNWKQVGGNDVKITLVNRPAGSGTRATFDQFALNGETPAQGITQEANNTVKKTIEQTQGAIGYLAFSYFRGNGNIVKLSINGVKPTAENIQSGKFPVWAYEHMYTKGKPDKLEKAFLDYMMSSAVQNKLVPAQGYISSAKMQVKRDAKGNVTKKSGQ